MPNSTNTLSQVIRDIFYISILLVIVAYFVGFRADVQAVGASLNQLILTATGRDSSGKFAAYPTGGTGA